MNDDELRQLIEEAATVAADEVVTHALSRDVTLPHAGRTAVLITLDNGADHSRPNTLGPRGLGELNAALDAALARDDVAAIAVTGKPFILAAGADLSGVPQITDREQALAIARIGHAVFDKLHTAAVPTFALHQRSGPRRRPGDRAALSTTAPSRRPRPGSGCRNASWACSRLGRGLPAAQPGRGRPRGHGDHRERR